MKRDKQNIDFVREEILNKGYYVFKNFASSKECILLRKIISEKLEKSPVFNVRINSENMPDYSHRRSHDALFRTTRYYSFYHNIDKWTETEKKILCKGLDLRNEIELNWIDKDIEYKKVISSLQDYNIFTKYEPSTGMLHPHRDWPIKLRYPLLQFNLILSQNKLDFESGEFSFEDYKKKKIKIHKDLNVEIGDALLFDKYLLHSVEVTEKGITDIGRWSVLIGARAEKITNFQKKKILLKEQFKKLFTSI